MRETVGRPLPQILGELIAIGDHILANTATAPNFLARLVDLQTELKVWKGGGTRFAEWILLGALASIANLEAETQRDLAAYLRIVQVSIHLTHGRIGEIARAQARRS